MNSAQAKKIPLQTILSKMGCKPTSQKGTDFWYYSPFREEKTPSFKLNTRLNTWYDFGIGQGGTVIDFICEYYSETVKQALTRLEHSNIQSISQTQTSFNSQHAKVNKTSNQFVIDTIKPLTDTVLVGYLQKRKINLSIARKYLQQIHFRYGSQSWQQKGLGFKNDGGGYEIRNASFKGFIHPNQVNTETPKTVTTMNIKNGKKLAIFEGFMDFLSYLTYQNIQDFQNSAVILNSVSNYAKVQELLKEYSFSKVYFFLDNDKAGRETVKKLTNFEDKPVGFDWVDMSTRYADFKDFNDFLLSTSI